MEVVAAVVIALRSIAKKLDGWLEKLDSFLEFFAALTES